MHAELNGVDITGPIQLPDTGGWQNWSTVTVGNIALQEMDGAVLPAGIRRREQRWLACQYRLHRSSVGPVSADPAFNSTVLLLTGLDDEVRYQSITAVLGFGFLCLTVRPRISNRAYGFHCTLTTLFSLR